MSWIGGGSGANHWEIVRSTIGPDVKVHLDRELSTNLDNQVVIE